jgi:hypothetical protein
MARKNRLAIVGLAAGLIGGGVAGIALTSPGIASGQSTSSDSTTSTTTKDGTNAEKPDRGHFLDDALAPLVENGTITQAQADAVKKAIEDARPDRGDFGPDVHGRFGGGHGPFGDVFGAAAKAIGVSVDDLRAALRDGKSIADLAKDHNVAVNDVVDAMVAAVKADLDQAVKDGHLSQSEADQHLADVRDRLNAMVNGELPKFGGERGHFFHGGPGAPGAPGTEDNGANGSNGSSGSNDQSNENSSFAVPA